jgi:putative salt-induced outer membrane protein
MKRNLFILVILACLVIPISSNAGTEKQENKIKTRTELSFVQTSGNTNTQTFSVKLEAKKEDIKNRYFSTAKALYAKEDGRETSNQSSIDGRWERVLSERLFGLLTSGFSMDKFSGYEYRLYAGPGLGYDLIKTDQHVLQSLLSLIYSYDEFSVGDVRSNSYLTGKLTLKYEWKILENLKLKEKLDYSVSFKDTNNFFIDSATAVETKINSSLSLGVSYVVNYQNLLPSPEIKHTDTTFLTTLIIDF